MSFTAPPDSPRASVPPHDGAGGDDVNQWRKQQRAVLLERRLALPAAVRTRAAPLLLSSVRAQLARLGARCVGLYWPFRGEIDVRAIASDAAMEFALPVVVRKRAPLEFRRWRPGDAVTRGVWNIPVPVADDVVTPDVVLVPLLGHDEAGFRLGYGGGYYDRTLAAADPRPLAIGIGFAQARLPSIDPQSYDIPMDVIITEDGVTVFRGRTG